MSDKVAIEVFGDDQFVRRMRATRYRARNMRPVMRDIASDFIDIVEEQFATEGARSGSPWPQLKVSTVLKRGNAHPILVDSAELLVEATDESNVRVTRDSVRLVLKGDVEDKAAYAQFGFDHEHAGHVGPRKIIDFTAADRAKFRRRIRNYLLQGDRSAASA